MKDGTTHLAYKPEHAVDLDTGVVVAAELVKIDFFVFGLDLLAEQSVIAGHAVTFVLPPHPTCSGLPIGDRAWVGDSAAMVAARDPRRPTWPRRA